MALLNHSWHLFWFRINMEKNIRILSNYYPHLGAGSELKEFFSLSYGDMCASVGSLSREIFKITIMVKVAIATQKVNKQILLEYFCIQS